MSSIEEVRDGQQQVGFSELAKQEQFAQRRRLQDQGKRLRPLGGLESREARLGALEDCLVAR